MHQPLAHFQRQRPSGKKVPGRQQSSSRNGNRDQPGTRANSQDLPTESNEGRKTRKVSRIDDRRVWLGNLTFSNEKYSKFAIPLKRGDEVSFVQNDTGFIIKVMVTSYGPRSESEVRDYLELLLAVLNSSNLSEVLLELLPLTTQWEFLTTQVARMPTEDGKAFLMAIGQIIACSMKDQRLMELALIVVNSPLLSHVDFQDSLEVKNFLFAVIKACPELSLQVLPALKDQDETFRNEVLEMLCILLSGGSRPDFRHWSTLAPVLIGEELLGNLVKEDKHLSVVRTGSPYSSTEEYLDTYYRLLRAEALSKIQQGIKDLLAGELDERDMHCYESVFLVGIDTSQGQVRLGLHFDPVKKVRDWNKSPRLMYGNLLCLSHDHTFKNPIWVTVADRDGTVLNEKRIIVVTLCDIAKDAEDSESVSLLMTHSGHLFMVESPTYYHAVAHTLTALKCASLEKFALRDEIVYGQPSVKKDVLNDVSATVVNATKTEVKTSMDPSQRDAFEAALSQRLAIIQGPPGCGKTFLGVKIMQTILKTSDRPMLVLTYKNHALDEFLKLASDLPNCGLEDIVRIGSRSSEPILEQCSLSLLTKDVKVSKVIHEALWESRHLENYSKGEVTQAYEKLADSTTMDVKKLLTVLNEEQLHNLVLNIPHGPTGSKAALINILSVMTKKYNSLCNIVESFINGDNGEDDIKKMFDILLEAANHWWPDKSQLEGLRTLERNLLKLRRAAEKEKPSVDDSANDDEEDEDYARELEDVRLAEDYQRTSFNKDSYNFTIPDVSPSSTRFVLSDFPQSCEASRSLLDVPDLWRLDIPSRFHFIYTWLKESYTKSLEELRHTMTQLKDLNRTRKAYEDQRKLEAIEGKKVIGMTITGASLYYDLIQKIKPKIVLVEEAAEVLEPSLLAALNPDVEHLILIGDQQQLRPQVETYQLVKAFNFDISMMERLIKLGYPYSILHRQNRMRPEFSQLLKDIYPKLEDNLAVVGRHKKADCLERTMFFWSHDFFEDGEKQEGSRSKVNQKEAEMAVALALFLVKNDIPRESITILASYRGQKRVIERNLQECDAYTNSKYKTNRDTNSKEKLISVQTIDMYQGDENEYVIVSLVRGNKNKALGFLQTMNRRCVAQSRAKYGMYFVGHHETFADHKTWKPLLEGMKKAGSVGDHIVVQCPVHNDPEKLSVHTSEDLMALVKETKPLCTKPCGKLFPCKLDDHACKALCSPKHGHYRCVAKVTDAKPTCGHILTKRCHEDWNNVRCETKVDHQYPKCGHVIKRKCCVHPATLKCTVKVPVDLSCGHTAIVECHKSGGNIVCKEPCQRNRHCGHPCTKKLCWQDCDKDNCTMEVTLPKPTCGHSVTKYCYQDLSTIQCEATLDDILPQCRHKIRRKCCDRIETLRCPREVIVTLQCKHPARKQCHQPDDTLRCEKQCSKLRSCGHPCRDKSCYEDCDEGKCQECEKALRKEVQKLEEALNKETEERKRSVDIQKLKSFGSTRAEYQDVEDKVLKYTKDQHNWHCVVTGIDKVKNLSLELKYAQAKLKAIGNYEVEKFHGTSDEGVTGITKTGFHMPRNAGMFGAGIYFATDSSKSAQEIYTKGSKKLLLCKVLLGRSKVLKVANNNVTLDWLRKEGYDSVHAPRNTGVQNDEFVIYDPAQAFPKYVIHYSTNGIHGDIRTQLPPTKVYQKERLDPPPRQFDSTNQKHLQFRFAEHLLIERHRLGSSSNGQYQFRHLEVDYIEAVHNPALEKKFDETKKKFKSRGISDDEVLAFHGTPQQNVDSILQNNLDPTRHSGQAYGPGHYFSEFPDVSLGYGNGLILFRTLPGKERIHGSTDLPYNSTKVVRTPQSEFGKMLIIEDNRQFVPFFVFHLKRI